MWISVRHTVTSKSLLLSAQASTSPPLLPALAPDPEKVQTLSAQIGWSHHQVLLDAFREDPDLYAWYAAKSVANRWSVRQLQTQIHLRLHEASGSRHVELAGVLSA